MTKGYFKLWSRSSEVFKYSYKITAFSRKSLIVNGLTVKFTFTQNEIFIYLYFCLDKITFSCFVRKLILGIGLFHSLFHLRRNSQETEKRDREEKRGEIFYDGNMHGRTNVRTGEIEERKDVVRRKALKVPKKALNQNG